ncbi:MAG: hypothetical protein H0U22_08080 [Geodermatophilaceae bacterium]|nr:hypothetical protein [Geodermatophilaceae bacterium]
MRLYAQTPLHRVRQQLGDLTLLAWCVAWILIASFLHGLVSALAGPGRLLEDAGRGLTDSMNEVSAVVGDVPVAGDALQAPFDLVGGVGDGLREAGQTQQDVVATLAFWLALVIAVLPIGWAAFRWLPTRVRWIREAAAARRMIYDVELFALRALIHRPLRELASVGPAPAAALRSGDSTQILALAQLELAALGLRPPVPPERSTRLT